MPFPDGHHITPTGVQVPQVNGTPDLHFCQLGTADWTNWKLFKKSKQSVLFGVSGSGKTRLVYEWLASEFGIYFVASTDRYTLGSQDFAEVKVLAEQTEILSLEPFKRFEKAVQLFQLLLFCRYCVMKHVQAELKYSPLDWLLLQTVDISNGTDMLLTVFQKVWERFTGVIGTGLPGFIPVIIDEAHIAASWQQDCFPSVTSFHRQWETPVVR